MSAPTAPGATKAGAPGVHDPSLARASDLLAELLWVEDSVRLVERANEQYELDLRNDFRTEPITVGETFPFEVRLTVHDQLLNLSDDAAADAYATQVRAEVEQLRSGALAWARGVRAEIESTTERAFATSQADFAGLHDAVVGAVSTYQAPPRDFADLADNLAVWHGQTKEALAAAYTRSADQRSNHVDVLGVVRQLISAAAGIDELGRVSLRSLSRGVVGLARDQLALRQQHRAAQVAEDRAEVLTILAAGTSVVTAAGGPAVAVGGAVAAAILDYTGSEQVPVESSEELALRFVTAADAAEAWLRGVARTMANIDSQYEAVRTEVDVQAGYVGEFEAAGTWTPVNPPDDLTGGFVHLTGL